LFFTRSVLSQSMPKAQKTYFPPDDCHFALKNSETTGQYHIFITDLQHNILGTKTKKECQET